MNDRFLNDLRKQWLMLLLALATTAGLRAQCSGPFNIACQTEINLSLDIDCRAEVIFEMVITGLSACLADSNFTIVVEDGQPENGALADGPGRFRYTVKGRNHPELENFDCWGFVTIADQTPPVISGLDAGPIARACGTRAAADINLLPAGVSRCYEVDGDTGNVLDGSLDDLLRNALNAAGGLPLVTDACGGRVRVCVNDVFDALTDQTCRDTVALVRSFTATQLPEETSPAPAVSAQTILFLRPRLSEVRGVEEVVVIDCLEGDEVGVNPLPEPDDFPYFETTSGPLNLTDGACQYAVDYVDGQRIAGCGKNYTFVRTFRLIDWCGGGIDTSFTQIVRVGDREAPVISPPAQDNDFDGVADVGPLRFPTNTGACTAVINVRGSGVSITDGCSANPQLTALVFIDGETENFPLGPFGNNAIDIFSSPLPVGTHLMRYLGRDACGNTSSLDVMVEIFDGAAPVMVCEDGFNVSLDGNGIAVLPAEAIDAGISDGCGDFNLFISKVDTNDLPTTVPGPRLVFSCEDLGPQRIMLEAIDNSPVRNANRCWLEVTIEDKVRPRCIPPPTARLTCLDFSTQLPRNLALAYAEAPETVGPQLDAIFGVASGRDNCPGTSVVQSIGGELGDCGVGRFTRLFGIRDAAGFTQQDPCRQVIDVLPFTEYSIRFPGDQRYACGELPTPEDMLAVQSGCELLTVNTSVDTLVADVTACYKLRLNHEVINWCEYDGNSRAINVPRDADGDGNFAQAVFLNIQAANNSTLEDDLAIVDQDETTGNGNDLRELIPDYGLSNRRGFFRYQQLVSVYDDEAPTLDVPAPEPGVAFTADCLGGVILAFTATDACGLTTSTVGIDTDVIDRNGDGQFTGQDYVENREIAEDFFVGDPASGVEVFIRNLPIGVHLARIRSSDGCGNSTLRFVELSVVDEKAPTPSCVSSLSTSLTADPDNGGIGVVWASDYVASPATVCTETTITYALYTEEEAGAVGFIPAMDRQSLTVSCADIGEIILRVYAFAESNGQSSFCNVALRVNANNGICEDRNGVIAGLIRTEGGNIMEGVNVYNDGPITQLQQTDDEGLFRFDGLEEGFDYSVQPVLNANPINGVSTSDINLIGRLLLGIDDGLSPYQLIAADANNNGAVTIRDLIMIREIILGLEEDFDNNNSWRFVPKDYVFPDPKNPWLEDFPEVANFNDMEGENFVEFVAIKIGDVNSNALPHDGFQTTGGDDNDGDVALELRPAENGQEWALHAGAGEVAEAMQFSLQLPVKTVVRPGLVSTQEFVVDAAGTLHVSYAPESVTGIPADQALLTLVASTEDFAPHLLDTPEALAAEAYANGYQRMGLELRFAGEAGSPLETTASVSPNPAREETTLRYQWPRAESVTLTISDLNGRLISQRFTNGLAGHNQLRLRADDFGKTGVYLLRLEGGEGRQEVLRLIWE